MTAWSVLVVEPHSDDAFLSLGGHIERWRDAGARVGILTVYAADRRRANEAVVYADEVGAEWWGLTNVEGRYGTRSGVDVAPAPTIETPDGFDVEVWPLGIRHPEHRAVAALAPTSARRYLDQPYEVTQANGDEVARKIIGRSIESWVRPGARKYRHTAIFKSQSLFFRNNPVDRLARIVEVTTS